MKAFEIIVTGTVQGVFFRASTLREARKLNLAGWVRNEPDGSVRIWAEGSSNHLDEFVSWCKKGPEYARVLDLQWHEKTARGYRDFKIER